MYTSQHDVPHTSTPVVGNNRPTLARAGHASRAAMAIYQNATLDRGQVSARAKWSRVSVGRRVSRSSLRGRRPFTFRFCRMNAKAYRLAKPDRASRGRVLD